MTEALEKLEQWRTKDTTYSIGGPYKGIRTSSNFRVTLYRWRSPRWLNEASKSAPTLAEAVDAAIQLWNERQAGA